MNIIEDPNSEFQANPKSQYYNDFGQPAPSLPNATAVLVLGILSLIGCCCYGLLGIILGTIALVLAKKDKELLARNPNLFSQSSVQNLNTGRICAIIGLSISAAYLIGVIIFWSIYGMAALTNPELFLNQ